MTTETKVMQSLRGYWLSKLVAHTWRPCSSCAKPQAACVCVRSHLMLRNGRKICNNPSPLVARSAHHTLQKFTVVNSMTGQHIQYPNCLPEKRILWIFHCCQNALKAANNVDLHAEFKKDVCQPHTFCFGFCQPRKTFRKLT